MDADSTQKLRASNETAWPDKLVAVFQNAFGITPTERRLADLLDDIRGGKFEQQVAEIRKTYCRVLGETGDDAKAKKAVDPSKKQLPAFCISGTAASRTELLAHSGLLQIDLDRLSETLSAVREKMKADKHCAFGFVSPSGDGLKLGWRIDGTRHKEAFHAAQAYFKNRYSLKIDPACKDRLRLCFVSHDPALWINPNAIIFAESPQPNGAVSVQEGQGEYIRLNPESCITASLNTCIFASLHNKAESVLENIKAKQEALTSLAANHPNLARLYSHFIEPRFQAALHARNDFIVNSVPFIYRAVAAQFVLELVGCFYDCNRALFHDPREQHMKEAKAMLESVAKTYNESLNADERSIYDALTGHERDAFRICRDLALLQSPDKMPGEFFMSFNQLGDRLGIYPTQAQRIMRQLASYGLVDLVKKGTRRALGVPGEAGEYKWLLSAHE